METSYDSSSSEISGGGHRNKANCVKVKRTIIILISVVAVVGIIALIAVAVTKRNKEDVSNGEMNGSEDLGTNTNIDRIYEIVSGPMREYTEPQFTTYIAQRKGLYIWSSTSLKKVDGVDGWRVVYQNPNDIAHLARFCVRHGIDVVLLYTGCVEWEYESYFQHGSLPEPEGLGLIVDLLGEFDVQVELLTYINDDINTFDGYEKIKDIIESIATFNEGRTHKVVGLHIDQEPNNQTVYGELLSTLKLAKNTASMYGLEINLALKPLWLTQPYPPTSTTPFATTILSTTDGKGTIMAYSSSIDKVIDYSKKFNELVPSSITNTDGVHAAIETGVIGAAENETLGNYVKKGKEWFEVASRIFNGMEENNMSMIVIHDYTQYHTNLYGADPHSSDIRVLDALWKDGIA